MMIAYVDSSVWITRIEGLPACQNIVESRLRNLEREGWTLCASEVIRLEVLYKPYRDNQSAIIALYHRVFSQIDILSNYEGIFQDALSIAPKENLRAIDSIHVALAAHYGCKRFIAADHHFKNLKMLPFYPIDLPAIR